MFSCHRDSVFPRLFSRAARWRACAFVCGLLAAPALALPAVIGLAPALALASGEEKATTGLASPAPALSFAGISPANSTPPDSHGAVGPNHVMTHINGQSVIRDRAGNLLNSVGLTGFWSSVGVSDVFDPKVLYDVYSNRFIAVACAQRRSSASGMLFGVSATGDPTGAWHLWLLDADAANVNWVDFPSIGLTADRITFTGNLFSVSGDNFGGVNIWTIDKASALDGGGLTMEVLKVTNAGGTLVPAYTHDAAQSTQYIVRTGTSNLFGAGRLQVYQITGSIGSLTFSQIPFASIGPAWSISLPNAKQLGTTATIETNDDRLMNAVVRNGRLWTVHTIGFNTTTRDHTAVQWWEIDPASGNVIQTGLIEDVDASGVFDTASGKYYYFPSVAVNSANDVLIGFTGSGALEYPSCYYAFRPNTAAAGLFNNPFKYKAGLGTYSGPRWGDYSRAVVDPVDDTSFWTVQQYTIGGNKTANFWAKVGASGGGGGGGDTTPPTVSGAAPTSSTTVRITFSETMQNNVALVNPANYTFNNGLTASAVTRLNSTQVAVTVNEMRNGQSYTATVSASGPTDGAGNTVSGSGNTAAFTGLGVAPTATITLSSPNPTNLNTVGFGVAFSESVGASFTSADVSATGTLASGAAISVSGGPVNFSVQVSPSNPAAEGTLGIYVGTGVTDLAGNTFAGATSPASYTLDNTPPAIGVNTLLTTDRTPALTGTVNDSSASIAVTVSGQTRTATNNGNGTWTLPDNSLSSLADGTYSVTATATDPAGNSATDSTANELTVDATPPSVTVNSRLTRDNTPQLTGSVSEASAVITVVVGGQTRTATNNGNGTWTLPDGSLNPLADGVYNVAVTAADAVGNMGSDGTSNELTIDTTAPVLTVNPRVTNDTRPALSGTTSDLSAAISLTVGGQTRTVTNNGNGTWSLADNSLNALAQGVYNVSVTSTDAAGNVGTDSSTNELTIDTTPPAVTVNSRVTNDTRPPLTGTVNDMSAAISIAVGGQTRTATNNGDGTWTLADNSLNTLANGTYNVAATATDAAGNSATDSTSNELVIDTVAPSITVATRVTSDTTPPLSGSVNDPAATISITVAGQTRTATNNGGTWSLPDGSLSAIAPGTYNVVATATDPAGNAGTDSTTNELTIDTSAPAVTVNTLLTRDNTPALSGTVSEPGATVRVSVGSQSNLSATNNGNGTWTLPDNTLAALADGVYNVSVTAADAAGNSGSDSTTNELTIDTVAPAITVASRTTNDNRPPLNGTVNDSTATISITVGGQTRTATNNGNGTWTLADNSLNTLANGTYNVAATATDPAGNAGSDATTNELIIDTAAPAITVNTRITNDTTPQLTGTVNDPAAAISITVGGQTRTATNNGNGTWTLADGALNALVAGTYNVAATATDAAGNAGSDGTTNELVIDLTPPAITVNSRTTNDNTPQLTGTVNDNAATISITVGGQTRAATNNGNGTWTLADGALSALGNGLFNVVATATDLAGNSGTDGTTGELRIDTVLPVITVNTLATTDTTPPLSGTISETGAAISITVGGQTRTATNNGNGTWTLANNQLTVLANGVYNVAATATDAAGNVGTDSTTNELTIDNTAPAVSVNTLSTNDQRPQLTGTVNDNAATIRVSVGGQTNLVAVNNANGTWTLPDDTINPALAAGTYNVTATATDPLGNAGNDSTTNELTIDLTAPAVTVNSRTTNDTRPQLTGTVNDNAATISVAVGGQTRAATNNGNGTWTLADNAINPALAQGVYNVTVTATDPAGNTATDATSNELRIDTTAPTVSVNSRITNDARPQLTGSVNDTAAQIRVDVGGQTNLVATNNGNGTWTLPDNTINPALANGVYNVVVRATDAAGNVGTDATSGELTIDTAAPAVSVNTLVTADNRPPLTGTVGDPAATVTVTVSGQTNTVTNNGDGTWTLADNVLTALPDNVYSVTATARDVAGNTSTDPTSNELTIDTTGPTVTVNTLVTRNTRPALSGAINDNAATVSVTVGGQTRAATNNGNGTWTLAAGAINPGLADGTYNVAVTATDAVGNTGSDSSSGELRIDTTLNVTVNTLTTSDTTPALAGTIDDNAATLTVTVDGNSYPGTNNGNGTWTLADNTINPPLVNGTYDVTVSATDALGNNAADSTTNELVIDATAPTITVNTLVTSDTRPPLGGTVSTPAAVITVDVGGQLGLAATNNGDGTWTLPDNTINPGLANGVYNVVARATAGGTGTDSTTNELTIDTVAPVTGANNRVTNDQRPPLTGTVNESAATITIDVGGQTNLPATNNGNGTWTLPNDTINPALAAGTYAVTVNATDLAGNTSNNTVAGALVIDLTAPAITVAALVTRDTTPPLAGAVNDNAATIRVDVGGQTNLVAVNNGDGTWSLPDNLIAPLAGGVYSVTARATDQAGNVGTDASSNELTIDITPPVITVTALATADNRPPLAGTVDDPAAAISIAVGGQTRAATNNGDGTWTLPDNAINPALADNTYNVVATATDPQGNAASDATTGELRIDTTPPAITVNSLTTSDNRPQLTGTVNDLAATVTVSVGGQSNLPAVNNGNGTWTLPDNTINPALADNTYNVVATATDSVGNSANDATTNELRVLTATPAVTVTARVTNDTTPQMAGTVSDPAASIVFRVNSIDFNAVNNGDGTWTLPDNTITPPLAEGVYSVTVRATNAAGITGQDSTNNELTIDVTAPVIAVNALATQDTRPPLGGTVNTASATVRVDVGGQTNLVAVNNGDGTWSLPDNTINPALAQGVYNVVARATDPAGNVGTDATSSELRVDTSAPAVTVNSRITNNNRPGLSGNVTDTPAGGTVTVSVTVAAQTLPATVSSGTWSLPSGALTALADGAYNVQVTATDQAGNAGVDATTNELVIDTTPPAVTVNTLNTNNRRPALTGTVNDPAATVRVSVGGQINVLATNNGDGTWTLPANTLTALDDGAYNVLARAVDAAGNTGSDATTDELRVDATVPVISVNPRTTNDSTPALSGAVDDSAATIAITVGGNTFPATNNGDGTWTLADGAITPALASGTYDVTARATDAFGNEGTDPTAGELIIDLQAPAITVTAFQTNDDTPPLTGTVDDAGAAVTVSVGGQTDLLAVNNGDGTWRLPDGALSPLADGVYDVLARAVDAAGNAGVDASTDELTINSAAPAVTVNALLTSNTAPALTGTINNPAADITISVGGQNNLSATNNGDGTWTLPGSALTPLADGVYNVVAEARDPQGNVAQDGTLGELTIDTTAPVIAVDALLTNDNRPELTGTVNDPDATIIISVGGQNNLAATNNGDGTWTLPDDAILTPLADDATGYDVVVTATDAAGNAGVDATTNELRIDTVAPVIAINATETSEASPRITGTVDDNFAAIEVTVNGQSVAATNNSNGTWTLQSGQLDPLPSGLYDVSASATDLAGNTGNAAETDALLVDVTPPVISVNTLVTTDTTPMLTGLVDDTAAVVTIAVAGQTHPATNNGNGTWTLPDNTLTELADGVYDVIATAVDALGNVGEENAANELTIDTSGPGVTITPRITNNTSPELRGAISEPVVSIAVTVAGNTYGALNNGDGTWTLAAGAIAPPLAEGVYDVSVVATDGLGNSGADTTTDELVIDREAPAITVDPLLTTLASPGLGGQVDDIFARITVTVDGQTIPATNIGNGTWALVAGQLDPLASGVYDVAVIATDLAGNEAADITADELTVDLDPPVIAVDELVTNDPTPPLSGTIDDPDATIMITVAGQTLAATNNGDGTWALADNALSALADGAYNVLAVATDAAGNVGADPTLADDLFIVTEAPEVTVIPVVTRDTTPQINGHVNQTTSSISVTVGGQTHDALNNGDGSWTLPDNTLTPLPEGRYDVVVSATDLLGNTGVDATADELTIDANAAEITITTLSTRDRTPALTGTVSDTAAPVQISVAGQTHSATNNGDGTWTLPDDTLAALDDGVYDVIAIAGGAVNATDATINELTIDTVGPALVVGGPSAPETQTGPVTFNLYYGPGAQVGLLLSDVSTFALLDENVTVFSPDAGGVQKTFPISTATASGVVSISGTGNSVRTVTVSDLTGDGYLGVAVIGGSAVDAAGNPAPSAIATDLVRVDNSAPGVEGAGVANLGILTITFDEPMGESALDPANYAIDGSGQGSLADTPDLVVQMSPEKYRLVWSIGSSINGGEITITVLNVTDTVGNLIGERNTATLLVEGVGVQPEVTGVEVLGSRAVAVRFSEPIDIGALEAANYTLGGSGRGTLAANPASISELPVIDPENPEITFPENRNGYRLTWDGGEMRQGGDITITVANVLDNSGDGLGAQNSATDPGAGIGAAPTVSAVTVPAGLMVEVTFSEPMGGSALDAANYAISGNGRGTLALNPDAVSVSGPGRYLLAWNAGEMVNGRDITITAANVFDEAGNPIGSPNSGTAARAGRDGLITVSIPARFDATLYEDAEGSIANGAGSDLLVGRAAEGLIRRGLLHFDVAGNIPAGSIVQATELILHSDGSAGNANSRAVDLLLAAASWTEGDSDAAEAFLNGAPAAPGDATWIHRVFDTAAWANPGGDFVAGPRATAAVQGAGAWTWESPEMLADVQLWLDDPDANFGWLLQGDESAPGTVKQFFSDEHPDLPQRPALDVIYSLNGGPGGPVLGAIGDQTVNEGATLDLELTAVDTGDNPLAFTAVLTSLPAGHNAVLADRGDGTAAFSWTPAFVDSGSYVVTFIATQKGVADPLSAAETIVISVSELNQTPVFEDPGLQSATEGDLFTFDPVLTDADAGDTHTYSLVASQGDADVDPETGRLTWTPGFSDAGDYTIGIRAVDSGNPPSEALLELQVNVADANGPPAIAPIGDQVVVERETLSFIVQATDPDLADTLAFALEGAPAGSQIDPETGMFVWTPTIIDGGEYDVTFVVTDDGDPALSTRQTIRIAVVDDNQDPTDIRLTPSNIAENQPSGTLVGLLTSIDPDAADQHAYTLAEGAGDSGNTHFSIVGNELRTATPFNFETQSSYSIRVQTFDGKDGTFARALTVSITNANDPPQSISLSNTTVDENAPAGTVVGALQTADEDRANVHVYSLVDGEGDADNTRFAISGDSLVTAGPIDFETQDSLSVRVRSADPAGASVDAVFTITVNDVNDTPDSVSLSNASVLENQPAATLVGEFMTGDADNTSHVYTLVSGPGATDNALFQIEDNALLTAAPLDFERARFRSIRVRTSDGQSVSFEMVFEIEVLDANDPPTDIILSAAGILGNVPAGTKIADIRTSDQDLSDAHVYSLVSGEGGQNNNRFEIQGSALFARQRINFDTNAQFNIRLRSTDQAGAAFEKAFVLTNDDVDGDGLSDTWELAIFGNLVAGPAEDADGDGLTNAEEFEYGTDPLKPDTDGDKFSDAQEIALGTDPLDPDDAPASLRVTPANATVSRTGGTVTLRVENRGLATMNWQATPVAGDFVEILSGGSGVDSGEIRVSVAEHAGSSARSATIRVSAAGAVGSPFDVEIAQEACVAPPAPANVLATNGTIPGLVRVTWNPAPDAERYMIYRGFEADPARATLLATVTGAAYTDRSAPVLGEKQAADDAGCALLPAPEPAANAYLYWVRATSACGTSAFSNSDDGFPGPGEPPARDLFEPVLPTLETRERTLAARENSPLAIRLRRDTAIDPGSIQGLVEFAGGSSTSVVWRAIDTAGLRDGWAVYTPEPGQFAPGDAVTFTVVASTVAGETIGPLSYTFAIETEAEFLARLGASEEPIYQPGYTDFDASALDLAREDNSQVQVYTAAPDGLPSAPPGAIGPAFAIVPDELYQKPQRVWIPLEGDLHGADVTVQYFFADKTGEESGWHAADSIVGWTLPDSFVELEIDGVRYVGFVVRHGGLIQVTTTAFRSMKPAYAATLPLEELIHTHGGNGIVLLGLLGAFGLHSMRRRRYTGS